MMGLAVCILIFLWVQDELSYDRFHVNADRIFRLIEFEDLSSGEVLVFKQQGPELSAVLKSDFPEIEVSTRFYIMSNRLVRFGDRPFYENGFAFADPQFLSMFTFPLKKGDSLQALADPSSIVLSERMAKKYFGRQDPIGKIFHVDNQADFVITGILENIPFNSQWIAIANVIAVPPAAYALIKYLNSYAYHFRIRPELFLIPDVMILGAALLTVSWQASRASVANPVKSLRYE
jgi:hypothetical protein